jgi:hypothetical protein
MREQIPPTDDPDTNQIVKYKKSFSAIQPLMQGNTQKIPISAPEIVKNIRHSNKDILYQIRFKTITQTINQTTVAMIANGMTVR